MSGDKLEEQIEERRADQAAAKERLADFQRTLRERLRFEELLSDLSARFVNTSPDQVDPEINRALRELLEFFQVDRCVLLQTSPDKTSWQITHVAAQKGVPPVPQGMKLAVSINPWAYDKLVRKREVLSISRLEDLPAEANVDKQTWIKWGIRSNLNIPIIVGEPVDHIFAINSVKSERVWPEEFIPRLRLLGEIFVNALERRQGRLQLEERLRFETLLADISTRFVNLPPEQIDAEIEEDQRRICELFDLDRSALWQVPEKEPGTMLLTHIYRPPGGPPIPERMEARDFFPWAIQKVMSGEHLAISKLADLPPESARDQESWHAYGTKSTLLVPLSTGGGKVFGLLTFAVMREERDWQEPVVKRLRLVAELFANALARKHADLALRESEGRLSVATDAAGAGLWIMELEANQVWVTARTRDLFHFPPDADLTYEDFVEAIHPEDRKEVRRAVEEAVQSRQNLHVEYRVALPDGSMRWILARGRPDFKSTGVPDRLMGVSVDITERKRMEEQLQEHLREIEQLKQGLERENIYLQEEIKLLEDHTGIVGQSPAMKKVLAQAEQVARTDSTVLILGETGTGKEILARAIHRMSSRKDRPLVTVNCASLPPTLIESELFGRERGAYTGALTKMIGRFEIADRSTLFLDEIGEIPLDLQSKLLRVLEEGNFERLGSTKTLHVDVRIIAATNRDIAQDVKEGNFRKDLFYRLNVFPIAIPPLRERREDIPLMVWAFVREFQKKVGKEIKSIPRKTMEALQSHSWPGNVRELRNAIEHAMIVSSGEKLAVLPPPLASSEADATGNLEDMERRHIVSVLEGTSWRVAGKGGAAEVLGLKRSTLYSKMKKLGIHRPDS